jgi:hypothetical protein
VATSTEHVARHVAACDEPTPPRGDAVADTDPAPQKITTHVALVDGGRERMAPGDLGISRRLAGASDRVGVSWRLDVPHEAGA